MIKYYINYYYDFVILIISILFNSIIRSFQSLIIILKNNFFAFLRLKPQLSPLTTERSFCLFDHYGKSMKECR